MSELSRDSSKYFASLDLDHFLPVLFDRIDHYYTHVMEAGLLALWRASHMARYSGFYVGGRMNDVGPNGKFTALEANEYANLMMHLLNMLTTQKAQPEAQARNMDHASQQQTIIANGLAETLSDDKGIERIRQDVDERMLLYGEGWCVPTWNKDLGEVYAVDAVPQLDDAGQPLSDEMGQPQTLQKPLHVGDIEYHVLHPLDVVRDATRISHLGHRWYAGRTYANRYDLMELYPQFADRIAKLPSAMQSIWDGKRPRLYQWYNLRRDDCDEVVLWTFMHDKTPAMQGGRIVCALAPDLAIVDDDLPYRTLPHIRASAAEIDGTIFGYSLFFDLLALQQGINAGVSAVATRMAAFGLPTVTGSPNVRLENLGDGMTCLTYSAGEQEPKLIDFAQVPSGIIEFIKMLRDLSATYSGINSVARGQPEGGVTAASALALLEARAIQFAALSQKADIEFTKRLFTTSLHHYQDHAVGEVIVRMTGKGNKSRVEAFTADKFKAVAGYTVGLGNALQATTAGRMQLVEGAKAAGVSVTLDQYWQVATTGRLEPVERSPNAEKQLIEAENEALSRGEEVRALVSDDHVLHLREHGVVGADPESRKNDALMQALLSHQQDHMSQWAQATAIMPALLAAKGIPPCPLPQPPPGALPPGPPGPPGPGGPPPSGKPNVAGPLAPEMPGAPPVRVERAEPAKNPMTGAPNAHPQVSA